jgi:D-sedoheptulose 7-phosphate isomerase
VTAARQEFDRRVEPGRALGDDAEQIARACHAMARRFQAGAKLVVFGNGTSATDAEHIAVEFVHPVIVGKRALPALSLAGDAATLTGVAARQGFEEAKALGCLTVALVGGDGGPIARAPFVDHTLVARSDDPQVVKEIHVTTYHILWELVHVFFEQATSSGALPSGPAAGGCAPGPPGQCITCSDQAVSVRVLELRAGDLALVDTGSGAEEVSVALVDARVGGRVLVHAGEAIAVVEESPQ